MSALRIAASHLVSGHDLDSSSPGCGPKLLGGSAAPPPPPAAGRSVSSATLQRGGYPTSGAIEPAPLPRSAGITAPLSGRAGIGSVWRPFPAGFPRRLLRAA